MKKFFKTIILVLVFLITIIAIGCGVWAICDKDGLIETWNSVFHPQNSGAIVGCYKIVDKTGEEVISYMKIDKENITFIYDAKYNPQETVTIIDDCLSEDNKITVTNSYYTFAPEYKKRNYKVILKDGYEDVDFSKITVTRISNNEFTKQTTNK